jgi:hypothetical protein
MRERDPDGRSEPGSINALLTMASRPEKTVALCWVTTPDAASWGPPLMYHVGEQVTKPPTESIHGPLTDHPVLLKKVASGDPGHRPYLCESHPTLMAGFFCGAIDDFELQPHRVMITVTSTQRKQVSPVTCLRCVLAWTIHGPTVSRFAKCRGCRMVRNSRPVRRPRAMPPATERPASWPHS